MLEKKMGLGSSACRCNGGAGLRAGACHAAVMRVYDSLIKIGRSEKNALEAAQIVYSYHHPEQSLDISSLIVERWVNEHHLQ